MLIKGNAAVEIRFRGWIIEKLALRGISQIEVEEAFYNFDGVDYPETRTEHKTEPETRWFISETCDGRLLHIVHIPFYSEGYTYIKSAWEVEE